MPKQVDLKKLGESAKDDVNDAQNVILTLDKATSDKDKEAKQQAINSAQVFFDLKDRISKLNKLSEKLKNENVGVDPEISNIIELLKNVNDQYVTSLECMSVDNVSSLNEKLQTNLANLQESCKSAEKACEAYVAKNVEKTSRLGALFRMILWVLVEIPTLIACAIAAPFTLGGSLVIAGIPVVKAYDQLKQVITGETNKSRDKVSLPREIQSNIKATLEDFKSENPVQKKEDPDLDEAIQGHMTPS
ncbi:MAG: hypothetical protein ACOVQX_05745 [Legionella sp.]